MKSFQQLPNKVGLGMGNIKNYPKKGLKFAFFFSAIYDPLFQQYFNLFFDLLWKLKTWKHLQKMIAHNKTSASYFLTESVVLLNCMSSIFWLLNRWAFRIKVLLICARKIKLRIEVVETSLTTWKVVVLTVIRYPFYFTSMIEIKNIN